jgi:hypothetical protein
MGAKDQGRRIHPRPRDWGDFIQVPTFERLSNQSVGKNGYAIAASRPACRLSEGMDQTDSAARKARSIQAIFSCFSISPVKKSLVPAS